VVAQAEAVSTPTSARLASLERAAQLAATPFYLTDLAELERRASAVRNGFPDPWIVQYSLKANPLPQLVRRLASHGIGANVVSLGEWAAASAAGVPNNRISFEGIGKTDAELGRAVQASTRGEPLRWLTVESADELRALRAAAHQVGAGAQPVEVLLRLNPEVHPETRGEFQVGSSESKFGLAEAELKQLFREHIEAASPVRIRGIHVHVGSQLAQTGAWVAGGVAACRVLEELRSLSHDLDTVDFGGGFPGAESPAPGDFREALTRALAEAGLSPPARAAVEPGRSLVASAGWLLTSVLHVRQRSGRPLVVVDASMSELIRPALYKAIHPIVVVRGSAADSHPVPTIVGGAVCESTDSFGVHDLPALRRGDLLAIAATGAYASSMFSAYNGRPRPAEVMLHSDLRLTVAREPQPFSP
jgi:diaminopimelate decarboxylase